MKFLLLVFPIQSFVISNIVKGLTPFNILSLLFIVYKFLVDRRFLKRFLLFIFLFLLFSFIQQFFNLFVSPTSNFLREIIFISKEDYTNLFLRKSLFTQSIYLLVVVGFFILLMDYIRKCGIDRILRFCFLSLWIFIIYGWIEFAIFLFTHQNPDFISNRITGENFHYGLFQTIQVGNITIQRMKSLAGEPSMYAFTVIPFCIISYYLENKLFFFTSFFSLIISTSTTAIIGLLLFMILDILMFRKQFKIMKYLLALFLLVLILKDYLLDLFSFAIAKFLLENLSGVERFSNFYNHINLWLHSDIFHFLFGYGWGYVRSTDGLSTLLVNVGIIGTVIYVSFFLLPYFLLKRKTYFLKVIFIANFVTLLTILVSVPEFYYPNIWILNALIWSEYFRIRKFERKEYVIN